MLHLLWITVNLHNVPEIKRSPRLHGGVRLHRHSSLERLPNALSLQVGRGNHQQEHGTEETETKHILAGMKHKSKCHSMQYGAVLTSWWETLWCRAPAPSSVWAGSLHMQLTCGRATRRSGRRQTPSLHMSPVSAPGSLEMKWSRV